MNLVTCILQDCWVRVTECYEFLPHLGPELFLCNIKFNLTRNNPQVTQPSTFKSFKLIHHTAEIFITFNSYEICFPAIHISGAPCELLQGILFSRSLGSSNALIGFLSQVGCQCGGCLQKFWCGRQFCSLTRKGKCIDISKEKYIIFNIVGVIITCIFTQQWLLAC